jgi:hypothetical protein
MVCSGLSDVIGSEDDRDAIAAHLAILFSGGYRDPALNRISPEG